MADKEVIVKLIKSAQFIRDFCKSEYCHNCPFENKHNWHCEFDLNRIPSWWQIGQLIGEAESYAGQSKSNGGAN